MRLLLPFLLVASGAHAQTLPVPPESRWPTLQRLQTKPGFKASTAWIEKARALEDAGTCTFKGKREGWSQVDIPFAVLVSPKGQVTQVAVADTGCAALEKYLVGVARRFGPKQIVPPKGTPPFWRGSRFVAGWQP